MGDDLIIGDFANGDCLALNVTASAVWRAIETPATMEQICATLTDEFAVDEAEALSAVSSLVDDWRARGLVRDFG